LAEIWYTYATGDNLERADTCPYAAKRNGRNRVISEVDAEVANPASAATACPRSAKVA